MLAAFIAQPRGGKRLLVGKVVVLTVNGSSAKLEAGAALRLGRLTVVGGRQRAVRLAPDHEALLERGQEHAQLVALVFVETGEQGILGLALGRGGANELPLPRGGQRYEVPAAILGVSVARDQPVGLERVEHRDEDARVGAHRRPELSLAHRAVIVKQPEQVELTGGEVVRGVDVAQSAHRHVPQERQ